MVKIILVLAMDKNGVIGKKNTIPFKLSSDLKHFKELTINNAIIMGRKTFESFNKPLPNREHIVVSKQSYTIGDITFDNMPELYSYISKYKKVFVIGGSQIAKEFLNLNLIDDMYITHVNTIVVDGDTILRPKLLKLNSYEIASSKPFLKDDNNEYDFSINHYVKKKKRFY